MTCESLVANNISCSVQPSCARGYYGECPHRDTHLASEDCPPRFTSVLDNGVCVLLADALDTGDPTDSNHTCSSAGKALTLGGCLPCPTLLVSQSRCPTMWRMYLQPRTLKTKPEDKGLWRACVHTSTHGHQLEYC